MRVLYLAPRVPFPAVGGDRLRVGATLRHLARCHEVTLLAFVEDEAQAEAARAEAGFLHRMRTVLLPRWASVLGAAAGALRPGLPLQVHYYRSREMDREVRRARESGCEVGLAHMIRMAPYLLQDGGTPTVVDLQDSLALHYGRGAGSSAIGPWRAVYAVERPRVARYEGRVAGAADASLLVSEVDARAVRERAPSARLEVVGNGVDLARFPFRPAQPGPDVVVLLGHMRTAPNQDMAVHFVRDVLPRIRARAPGTRFRVVGAHPSPAVLRLHDGEGVVVTGEVPDVVRELHAAAVSVCPMRLGAGVQNKVLESMAAGVPVVATPMGIEGIPARPGVEALVAEGAEGLAGAVCALLAEPGRARDVAARARELVETRLTWDAQLAPLGPLIEDVVADFKRRGGRRRWAA